MASRATCPIIKHLPPFHSDLSSPEIIQTDIITVHWIVVVRQTWQHFKNAFELLNMGRIFCVKFQRVPLKFHTKYLTHTFKDVFFIQCWKFQSSQIIGPDNEWHGISSMPSHYHNQWSSSFKETLRNKILSVIFFQGQSINPLCPSDVMWNLVNIGPSNMACCLTAPSCHLNQYQLLVNRQDPG